MAKARTWVGLDVHAAKVVAAIARSRVGRAALAAARRASRARWSEFCAGLPGPVRASL